MLKSYEEFKPIPPPGPIAEELARVTREMNIRWAKRWGLQRLSMADWSKAEAAWRRAEAAQVRAGKAIRWIFWLVLVPSAIVSVGVAVALVWGIV